MTKDKKILITVIVIVLIILIIALVIFFYGKKEKGPVIAEEIYGFSGEIKEIRDKNIWIEAKILLANPEEEPVKKTLKIVVADDAEILRISFPKEIPSDPSEPIFPIEQKINLTDLKAGDKIDVETLGNVSEDINNKTEILAKTINLIE